MRPLTLLLLVVLALARPAAAQDSLRIAAVVNDEVISLLDLNQRIGLAMASAGLQATPEVARRFAPQVLRTLIDERLQGQEAKRLNITVAAAEIDRAIARIEEQNRLRPGQLRSVLEERKVPIEALQEQVSASISWQRVVSRRFGSASQVPEEEVDDFIARQMEGAGKPEYQISEILLTVEAPEREEEIRAVAARLVDQVKEGASFQAVARQFSQSASAAQGGALGWIPQGEVEPVIEQALRGAQSGAVVGPLRGAAGWYVIRLEGSRISAPIVTAGETLVLKQILVPVTEGAADSAVQAQAQLAREIGGLAASCADFEALAKELRSPISADYGTVRLTELPANIRAAVGQLGVGQASEPVRTPTGFLALMVCERRNSPTVSAEQREDIRRRLVAQKLEGHARRLLRDLRRAAFVEVRV